MPWSFPKRDADGRLSLQEAIFEVATSIMIRSRTPKIFYSLPISKLVVTHSTYFLFLISFYSRLKAVDEAYTYFVEFMQKRILSREIELNQRRELDGDVTDGIRDVFGRLVNARLTEGKLSLSETEIIGNCFIFVSSHFIQSLVCILKMLGILFI